MNTDLSGVRELFPGAVGVAYLNTAAESLFMSFRGATSSVGCLAEEAFFAVAGSDWQYGKVIKMEGRSCRAR